MISIFTYLTLLLFLGWLTWFAKNRTEKAIFSLSYVLFHSPKIGIYFYFLLFFPGIVLHELSHLFTAAILGVPTGEIRLMPKTDHGNYFQLGQVSVAHANPIKESIIGAAPLITGIGAILFIAYFGMDLPESPYLFSLKSFPGILTNLMQIGPQRLLISGYGIVAISSTMFLSESDSHSWIVLPIFVILIGWFLYAVGIVSSLALTESIIWVSSYISAAFVTAIVIDAVFFLPLGIIHYLLCTRISQ